MSPEVAFAVILFAGPTPGGTLYSPTPTAQAETVAFLPTPAGRSAYQVVTPELEPPQCLQPLNPACRRSRLVREGSWVRPETFEEGLRRYWDLARAIALEVEGDDELGELVATTAINESGLWRSVQTGERSGDSGRSHCYMQINAGRSRNARVMWVSDIRVRDIVGLDAGAVCRCVYVGAQYLRIARDRCERRGGGPACIFVSYMGGRIKLSHPGVRARLHTLRMIREAEPQVPWWATEIIER